MTFSPFHIWTLLSPSLLNTLTGRRRTCDNDDDDDDDAASSQDSDTMATDWEHDMAGEGSVFWTVDEVNQLLQRVQKSVVTLYKRREAMNQRIQEQEHIVRNLYLQQQQQQQHLKGALLLAMKRIHHLTQRQARTNQAIQVAQQAVCDIQKQQQHASRHRGDGMVNIGSQEACILDILYHGNVTEPQENDLLNIVDELVKRCSEH